MTCKNCLHCNVCAINGIDIDNTSFKKELCCGEFKDKSKIIELPDVEIGQKLFFIDRYTKQIDSDEVSKLSFEINELGTYTGIWSENNKFSVFFSDMGKIIFTNKEEAEEKLKEVTQNDYRRESERVQDAPAS